MGDGIFLACEWEDFLGRFDDSFLACTFLFVLFFEVEVSSSIPVLLFRPGLVHSG